MHLNMPGAISIIILLFYVFNHTRNLYILAGQSSKATDNFKGWGKLPKFIYSDSFSFSGHQQVAPQLGSCPVNVQYCNMTQELLRNNIHSPWQNNR